MFIWILYTIRDFILDKIIPIIIMVLTSPMVLLPLYLRIICTDTLLCYGLSLILVISLFFYSYFIYNAIMALFHYIFYPEGVGCDIEYYYCYSEGKIIQSILGVLVCIFIRKYAINPNGCELLLCLTFINTLIVCLKNRYCLVRKILNVIILTIEIMLIFIYTNYLLVFLSTLLCIPLKIFEKHKIEKFNSY